MEKTTALYAYFGELGVFSDNIPGHTFYQVGLLDSLSGKYEVTNFDFYNYLTPSGIFPGRHVPVYPISKIGDVFENYTKLLVNRYLPTNSEVRSAIKNKLYKKIFLKARFRNLSTLEKKMKDARDFEDFISFAMESGYNASDIVIIDTDLSLSDEFIKTIDAIGIIREIPSVTVPAIGKAFLEDCMLIHDSETEKRKRSLVYYGNLSFDNYKAGHSKNPIILDVLNAVPNMRMFDESAFSLFVACKETPELAKYFGELGPRAYFCPRNDRATIFNAMSESIVSINVSKDLYIKEGFTPARVYESIIFGAVPVSYMKGTIPALGFETVEDFVEIAKYIADCSPADYKSLLRKAAAAL